MNEVKRYELRIITRYAGDGSGEIETDASMKIEARGRYVLAADYDALAAELATERLRADAAVGDANAAECRVAELEELMASQAKAIREEREAYAMSMKAQQPSGLVLPGRMITIPEGKTISYAAGYEAALDAVASLNRTVPLELLEQAIRCLDEKSNRYETHATKYATADQLRAILAGVKP